jgi:hypothetical protein
LWASVRSGTLLFLAFEPRAVAGLVLFCPCRVRDKFCLLILPPMSSLFPPPEFAPAHELVRRPAVLALESCSPDAISISWPELHLRLRSSVFCELGGLAFASTRRFSFQGSIFVSARFSSWSSTAGTLSHCCSPIRGSAASLLWTRLALLIFPRRK